MLSREMVAPSACCDSASVNPVFHPTVTSLDDSAAGADTARHPPGWRGANAVAVHAGLLTLRVGTPISEALELASSMTVSACHTVRRLAMDEHNEQTGCLWSVVHLLETTANILDDSINAVCTGWETPNRPSTGQPDRMAADAQDGSA